MFSDRERPVCTFNEQHRVFARDGAKLSAFSYVSSLMVYIMLLQLFGMMRYQVAKPRTIDDISTIPAISLVR